MACVAYDNDYNYANDDNDDDYNEGQFNMASRPNSWLQVHTMAMERLRQPGFEVCEPLPDTEWEWKARMTDWCNTTSVGPVPPTSPPVSSLPLAPLVEPGHAVGLPLPLVEPGKPVELPPPFVYTGGPLPLPYPRYEQVVNAA